MSFNRIIQNSLRHQQEHRLNNITTIDLTCPICHPVIGEPDRLFQAFWRWFSREFPTASGYSLNTVNSFQIADRSWQSVNRYHRITNINQRILPEFSALIGSVHYRNSPIYSAGDIAYVTTITPILTHRFTGNLDIGTYNNISRRSKPCIS